MLCNSTEINNNKINFLKIKFFTQFNHQNFNMFPPVFIISYDFPLTNLTISPPRPIFCLGSCSLY